MSKFDGAELVMRAAQRDPVGVMRAMSSILQSRGSFAQMAGLTFNGDRDIPTALGFKFKLEPEDYRLRFRRGGIGARIVEAKPESTWDESVEIIEDESPDIETEFELAWKEVEARLNVWSAFYRLDVLAGLGRYAILLMGLPGADLAQPAPDKFKQEEIAYLTPYDEDGARISRWETTETDSRYGLPVEYTLRVANARGQLRDQRVHWSRVLHVADGMLDSRVYGLPRLERPWNDLDNLEKVVGGGSEAFWLRVNRGLFVNVKDDGTPETALTPEEQDKLDAAMDEYVHKMRRTVLARGIEVKETGSDVSSFGNQVDSILTLIAGQTGIPKRILLGAERGELASSQDADSYDKLIANRRTQYATPVIIRPFIDRLIIANALPEPVQYVVRWPERESMNDEQRASVAVKLAGLNESVGETVVTAAEIRDRVLKWPTLDEADQEQTQVFSGIQIEQASILLQQISLGVLTKDQVLGILQVMYNLTLEDAELLVRDPLEVTTIEQPASTRAAARKKKKPVTVTHIASDRQASVKSALATAIRVARKKLRSADDVDKALDALAEALDERLTPALHRTLVAGGEAASKIKIPVRERAAKQAIKLSFDKENPKSTKWAKDRSSRLITEINSQTREAIRELISGGFDRQRTVRQTARDIRQIIGLTSRDAGAVQKLRFALENADDRDVYAGRRRISVPGGGFSDTQIDEHVDRYADDLLDRRAENIARTETIAAANEGQRELWEQGIEAGFIDETDDKIWIAATGDNRTCPICEDMDGQTVGVKENFELPDGAGDVSGPPAHPSCRCGQGLVLFGN